MRAIAEEKQDFFDMLQAKILVAGGAKIPMEKLHEMRLGKVMDLLLPNGLTLRVMERQRDT